MFAVGYIVKGESVFRLTCLMMSLLSDMVVRLCVCVNAQGMLMPGLVIPCELSRLCLLCNRRAQGLSSAYKAGKTDRQGKAGWMNKEQQRVKVCCYTCTDKFTKY